MMCDVCVLWLGLGWLGRGVTKQCNAAVNGRRGVVTLQG